ncbi:hypothetical protein L249_5066, partial [Ophiocordyceps polyrhachis-furcata BCC 54312]
MEERRRNLAGVVGMETRGFSWILMGDESEWLFSSSQFSRRNPKQQANPKKRKRRQRQDSNLRGRSHRLSTKFKTYPLTTLALCRAQDSPYLEILTDVRYLPYTTVSSNRVDRDIDSFTTDLTAANNGSEEQSTSSWMFIFKLMPSASRNDQTTISALMPTTGNIPFFASALPFVVRSPASNQAKIQHHMAIISTTGIISDVKKKKKPGQDRSIWPVRRSNLSKPTSREML